MNKKPFSKFILLAAACSAVALGGCKKYLDQQPITAVSTNVVFDNVDNARSALIAAYQQLTGDNGYGLKISLYFPVGTDENQGPTGADDGGRRSFPLYATTAGNTQINWGNGTASPYLQLFRGIQYANVCIENIPKMDLYTGGTDQQKKQLQRMLGEALTLRAQFYFEAIRNWGDLPSHFDVAEAAATQDPYPTRTDRDVLYGRLLDDLKTAAGLVPWRNEVASIGDAPDERITKGTVKGLRARIALARGGYSLRTASRMMERGSNYQTYYQIARDETAEIIASNQHSLNPSFRDLWKNQVGSRVANDPQGELMFQATAIGRVGAADTKIGYYNGPTVVDAVTQSAATGVSGIYMLPTYFYLFDSTDTRRDVTCIPAGDTLASDGVTFYKRGFGATNIFDGKYRRSWLNPVLAQGTYLNNYSTLKWQILRYADVLLMFAEAENELNGPTAAAYNAINAVRRRGYGKDVNAANAAVDIPAGLSKDVFFKYIVRERALELGDEGVRKYDLIRWNLLTAAINETKANTNVMSAFGTLAQPTYMAGYPAYVLNTSNLPTSLYYRARTASDDMNIGGLVLNSLYAKAPTSTPAGTTKVTWLSSTTATTVLAHYATNFVPNKSELMPIPQDAITAYGSFAANMPQNPGY